MSKFTDIEIFEILKKSISNRFLEENSAQSPDISHWKGQEIAVFQEDLFNKTKSTVSEKWFYTYFKTDFKKLPRIDMLNLLSQYCGYKSWAHFLNEKEVEVFGKVEKIKEPIVITRPEEDDTDTAQLQKDSIEAIPEKIQGNLSDDIKEFPKKDINSSTKKIALITSIVSLVLLAAIAAYMFFFQTKNYQFCFVDSDRQTLVKNSVEVTILRQGFTPLYLTSKTGCIDFESKSDTIKMVVSTPYHKLDTFRVNLHQYREPEKIILEPDDYKVMLYYYSNSAKDLKQRISKLNQMIDDNALIYQVYDNDYFGVEILTKQQYINLVSLPTTSLKNYNLIESESKNGKIVKLKFKIQQDEEDN
ncbi:hypothetical protein [Faecalibacter rhinopitheci]|uniref:Uncharacterized protein n=1 Tax=Faecalibacter rhinopitheci TaxID=2779678 RepID=A0A8J7KIH5_9FLAO|nr:hypothetical protein [Faecalibacter rhinopitheci]MBF0597771.1 hypothetical protein [Faecalibacter rhinopitheci]